MFEFLSEPIEIPTGWFYLTVIMTVIGTYSLTRNVINSRRNHEGN